MMMKLLNEICVEPDSFPMRYQQLRLLGETESTQLHIPLQSRAFLSLLEFGENNKKRQIGSEVLSS